MRISDWSSDVCSSDLDEDAAARGARNPRKNGARGRDGERTGARGDQYGHCAIKAVAEGLIDHDPGEEQDKEQREHARHEDALEAVGDALSGRLLRLGTAPHLPAPGNARKSTV